MHAVSRRRGLGTTLTAACMALVPAIAWAQGASDKPLRIIAAGPPGGNLDVVSRLLADGLQKELNRTVIVEGKPGGGGVFAVNELMQAPRDGNTMVVTLDALVSEIPHAMKLRIDMAKEVKPDRRAGARRSRDGGQSVGACQNAGRGGDLREGKPG